MLYYYLLFNLFFLYSNGLPTIAPTPLSEANFTKRSSPSPVKNIPMTSGNLLISQPNEIETLRFLIEADTVQ